MKYILKRHPVDFFMIEFFYESAGRRCLAGVQFEDAICDDEIWGALNRDGGEDEVEVEMTLVAE